MPPTVEELAQIHSYMKVAEETSAELWKSPAQYQATYERFAHSSFTAQPGQGWVPPREERLHRISGLNLCNCQKRISLMFCE
jgi:hypothetical protein